MPTDIQLFLNAFQELATQASLARSIDSAPLNSACEKIAAALGVDYLETILIYSEDDNENCGEKYVFYGTADDAPAHSIRIKTNGKTVVGRCSMPKNASETECDGVLNLLTAATLRFDEIKNTEYMLYHDRDLGIFNTDYLAGFISKKVAQKAIGDYCACSFNLKSFSVINSQVGRDMGTCVMRAYISRLEGMLSNEEIVARRGGDNFIVLFYKKNLEEVMEHLGGCTINCGNGSRFNVSAHAGYYMLNNTLSTADIMDGINTALHTARYISKLPYVFYDERIQSKLYESKQVESDFPAALENEEFLVYYQPKTMLKDYRLYGAEALCRWHHNGEMIPPFRFIPVLEQSVNICKLDFYMLDHVCRDIRRWLDEGKQVVKVSVNLSRRHLGDVDLLDNILKVIDKHNVPHEYIEIELTETTTDVDFQELKRIVSGLRREGISTSVDDFGIGYSSLNLIRELPWNVLKIDKSFLPDGGNDEDEKKKLMLKSVIEMSQALGLECIAEGVETVEQIRFLKENNCYLAQGFYFDKPLPVEDFEKRLSGV